MTIYISKNMPKFMHLFAIIRNFTKNIDRLKIFNDGFATIIIFA